MNSVVAVASGCIFIVAMVAVSAAVICNSG